MIERIERRQLIAAPLPDVFAFFSRARNLEELTPPWLRFEVLTEEPIEMRPGALIEYRLRLHGLPLRWMSRIEDWEPERGFVDRQLRGPFRLWHHTHEFARDPRGTIMRDSVRYALPLGPIGTLAHVAFVRSDLSHVFDYRREQIARLLQAGAIAV